MKKMSKNQIIHQFCAEFSRTRFDNAFKAKLLPYDALAKSLNLKMWHDAGGFDFRLNRGPMMGRLIARVPA